MFFLFFFFFNATATTEIYTLSLHDALPISMMKPYCLPMLCIPRTRCGQQAVGRTSDRKSTRLNSSHQIISYAVFCLKKKKKKIKKEETDREEPQHKRNLTKDCSVRTTLEKY